LHERSQEKDEESTDLEETKSPKGLADDVLSRIMLKEIERFLENQHLYSSIAEQNLQAKRFLELMQVEAGLIVERGTDENGESLYGFVHRTFQEYFAAADVYERYLQEEDATIISEFLVDHLHDPHWREVILLLFGKLKRKPATAQLRQILNGKIKSRRSQYTDIVQQDLFFVCDCLIEEIAVENELAELVISQLSNLVKSSPFPSQCTQALETLGELMQTRQYADLAQGEMKAIVTQNLIADIPTIVEAARIFLQNSLSAIDDRLVAQTLFHLAQSPKFSIEQTIWVAKVLYENLPDKSEAKQQATQLLLHLAQRSDLSIEQTILVAKALYETEAEQQASTLRSK
jgi:hypothetical protein